MQFPENDNDFEEVTITEVSGDRESGWQIKRSDGWSFWICKDSPVEPAIGMSARFYGKGIGASVRGVFIDGQKVYYRTAAEDEEFCEIEMYGSDAADWLKRWDEGKTVWSIEMGGLGPAYEQCIHMTCAELVRQLIDRKIDFETNDDLLKEQWKAIDEALFQIPEISALGLSGAQVGAAKNLAAMIYRHGPRAVMKDERVKDRHIQVQKFFPGAAKAA